MRGEGGVHFASEHLTSGERPHIILGEDVAAHFQPDPDRRRVLLRHGLQRGCVIRGGVAEHEVEIDRGEIGRMTDLDLVHVRACRPQSIERLFETSANLVVEQIAKVRARDREPQSADRHRRRRRRSVVSGQRVIHETRIPTLSVSGPT